LISHDRKTMRCTLRASPVAVQVQG
jgi:hypothetical protein